MTVLCLDIEASGLGSDSFPIEVALASVDTGEVVSWLVHPPAEWMTQGRWDERAEALHGLSLDFLTLHGLPPAYLVDDLSNRLWGASVLSDNPAHDAAWLRAIYNAAGMVNAPCEVRSYASHLAELGASEAAMRDAEAAALATHTVHHRAGPDAARLAFVLRAVGASPDGGRGAAPHPG